ncbi:hypothetical protein DF3PB_220043 [uncultured Defluviicoccus sp.]|uniref:Uncharacterized protein n=1 Tax=metagenome TaxID=256318 RepID=A0A380TBT5_9ZZZZ|nr:hypothetical protein DF3PB_220043 [uncultured Defluviicoccus sp.]
MRVSLSEGLGRTDFAERRPAINEDLSLPGEASEEPRYGNSAKRGMPSVEGANAQSESEIKRLLSRLKLQSFYCHFPKRQSPCGNLLSRASTCLLDGLCGAINAEHVCGWEASNDFPSSDAWSAADLKHSNAGAQRQSSNRLEDPGRHRCRHLGCAA